MVDKKEEQVEDVIKEPKPVEKETKSVAQKDTSNYSVNLFEGDRIVGQVSFNSAKNSLEVDAPDREGLYQLEIFVTKTIAVEGRRFNPVDSPKEWVQNLCNVSPLALYKTWSASEARKI